MKTLKILGLLALGALLGVIVLYGAFVVVMSQMPH
jgi:hypothetical protein